MKKIEMVKTVGAFIVSIGVGAIIGNGIKATTPAQVGTIKKVCTAIGAIVLSNMVGDAAVKYTEEKIDSAVAGITKMVDEEKQEETEEELS
jgi:hypothetical protein